MDPFLRPVLAVEQLVLTGESLRSAGRTIVWTNGCFDLFHAGHARSLRSARALGDVLIVGVNSDASVLRLKGTDRPLQLIGDRCEILASLACVDFVVPFDEETPERCLSLLRPDVHCKGADYAPPDGKAIPEAAVVTAYGGRIAYLPLVEGRSTSELLRRLMLKPDHA